MGALALVATEKAFRAPSDSHIRLTAVRPELGIGALADGQRALSEGLLAAAARLERPTYDPSVRAALKIVAARLDDVRDAYESLDDVIASLWLTSDPPRAGSPLVRYFEGTQRFLLAVVEELDALAVQLLDLHADWSKFRFRLGLAKAEWPTELIVDLERELVLIDDEDVTEAAEEMAFALHVLDANLSQRFG